MDAVFYLAFLFLLILVFNAALVLFVALVAFFILHREACRDMPASGGLPTGFFQEEIDAHGKKHYIAPEKADDMKRRMEEESRLVEEWTMK